MDIDTHTLYKFQRYRIYPRDILAYIAMAVGHFVKK